MKIRKIKNNRAKTNHNNNQNQNQYNNQITIIKFNK